MFVQEKSCSN